MTPMATKPLSGSWGMGVPDVRTWLIPIYRHRVASRSRTGRVILFQRHRQPRERRFGPGIQSLNLLRGWPESTAL